MHFTIIGVRIMQQDAAADSPLAPILGERVQYAP